ncbi:MAG: hypothetical protein GTO13_03205 [Proteobacteria bacterium]|nr:hypothetical protein [Pseudomonadota bacterium]
MESAKSPLFLIYIPIDYAVGPSLIHILFTISSRIHRNWRQSTIDAHLGLAMAIPGTDMTRSSPTLCIFFVLRVIAAGKALLSISDTATTGTMTHGFATDNPYDTQRTRRLRRSSDDWTDLT